MVSFIGALVRSVSSWLQTQAEVRMWFLSDPEHQGFFDSALQYVLTGKVPWPDQKVVQSIGLRSAQVA